MKNKIFFIWLPHDLLYCYDQETKFLSYYNYTDRYYIEIRKYDSVDVIIETTPLRQITFQEAFLHLL